MEKKGKKEKNKLKVYLAVSRTFKHNLTQQNKSTVF